VSNPPENARIPLSVIKHIFPSYFGIYLL